MLIEDRDLLARVDQLRLLPEVPEALRRLKTGGFRLIVVSNQAVVARGMISEADLDAIHAAMCRMLGSAGAPPLDGIYSCPHHPEAAVPAYRVACQCRKPRPGMLLRAAREHGLNLAASFMVGDRITDIIAGERAGCRTILVESPRTTEPPIVTLEPLDASVRPGYVCPSLLAAADWILTLP